VSPDVFISYSREDQQQVNRLAGYLREQGLNVWMDETDIHGATMWTEEIVEAIHGCTLFILAISSHSTGSKNVVKELALASEREKKILPLYLEESQIPKNMEYQLAGIQNIALYTLDKAKAYEFVHQTIRRLGVGQTQPDDQALGQAAPTPPPGHGTGHMPPPKAKGSAGKWVAIAAGVVILAVAGLFLAKGGRDVHQTAPPSTPATPPSAPIATDGSHRIALLPFEVNAAKEEDKWVGGGMDNELKTALNKIDGVTIIAGLSVNGYRGANREISKIKANLNVDYILDGSITVADAKATLSLDFINANDLSTVWSDTIQATPGTVFDSKTRIATKLASSLNIQIGEKTVVDIGTKHTENAGAFRLYTQGRTLWMTRSQAGMKRSITLFGQAIALDDKFALAYTGIADAYSMLCQYGYLDYEDGYPKARLSVLDAITRKPDLAEAYISLGWIQFAYEWKLKDSEESYRKAIKLNPKIAQAHQWLGLNIQTQGRKQEANESLMRGLNLDPNHLVINANLCMNTFHLGKLDEAEKYAKKALNINPNFFDSWIFLYSIYLQEGQREKEITALIKEIEEMPNKNSSKFGILVHYHRDIDQKKSDEYYELADKYDKTVNNTALQDRLLVKIGFDDYMKLAEEAYENNTLPFNFEHTLFIKEHRDNPKYKAFVEKIRKGK
jgi:TolB-like protein/Tfp pilus assembly protein PilF